MPPPVRLSEQTEQHLVEYKPVSTAAVLGLLLAVGSLSVLVVDHPSAWSLPALSVAVCMFALRRIAAADPPMQGRTLAVAGLLTSLVLLAFGPSHRLTRHWQARHEARQFAQAWIEHLQNHRHREAHQMTLDAPQRCPSDGSLSACYSHDLHRQESLDRFVEDETIARLLTWRTASRIEFSHTLRQSLAATEDLVANEYRVRVPASADRSAEDHRLRLLLRRRHERTSGAAWWRVSVYRLLPG